MRRGLAAALVATLAFLVAGAPDAATGAAAAPASAAAMCVRVTTEPNEPRAGELATVVVRPYWPSGGTLRPATVRSYPFRVQAVSPRGTVSRVPVARGKDGARWTASFRFGARGRWRLRVANWGPRYDAWCAPVRRVLVH